MTPELLAIMLPLLRADEGCKLVVYDDSNGRPIGPGSHVVGHPTIGIGRALDVHGLSPEECDMLLDNDLDRIAIELDKVIPWWRTLSAPRQAVLASMAFQLGVQGLMAFTNTLSAIKRGDYAAASLGMLSSKWAQQTPGRVARLVGMMRGKTAATK